MPKAHTTNRPISVNSDTLGENNDQILLMRSLTSRLWWLASPETLGLALLLGKGLRHTDTGDGVGQHVGHLAPNRSIFSKPVRRRSAQSGSSSR